MTVPGRSACFPHQRRVRKRREFLAAQRRASRASAAHFVLLLHRRRVRKSPPTPAVARLGIVASRKVGSATARNHAKRLVREWFRQQAAALPDGIDLIVIVRPGAAALGLAQVAAELDVVLRQLLRRAGLSG